VPAHGGGQDAGLRAVMFTDIVGSTEMTARLGDSAALELVRVHDALVRRGLEAYGGREIKHTGDRHYGFLRPAAKLRARRRRRKDRWLTNERLQMWVTRPTRRSPIRLLSATRNSSLNASRSLNRIAGASRGAGRSFEATDHRAAGERTPRDLDSSFERVHEHWAVAAVGERVGPVPVVVSVRLFSDRPAFAPNGSKGAQP
jgi:hypothetical protein